jgi:hypothetical protein
MRHIILVLTTAVVAVMIWMWQMEGNFQNAALVRGKDATNFSAHDASMQVIKSKLSEGQVVFDQTLATQVFQESLTKNLQLQNDLTAKPNTLFHGQVEIVFKDFVDDSNVTMNPNIDPTQRTAFDGYGKLYKYDDPAGKYHIQQTIMGPAVVYIIKVAKPINFDAGDSYYYIGSVFEYPFYN